MSLRKRSPRGRPRLNPEKKMTVTERVNKHMVMNKIDAVVDILRCLAVKAQPWLEKNKQETFEAVITFHDANIDINGQAIPYMKHRKNAKKVHYIVEET